VILPIPRYKKGIAAICHFCLSPKADLGVGMWSKLYKCISGDGKTFKFDFPIYLAFNNGKNRLKFNRCGLKNSEKLIFDRV